MIVRKIHLDELPESRRLSSLAFEWVYEDEEPDKKENKTPEELEETEQDRRFEANNTWAAFDEETGEMMASLSVTPFQVYFDGSIVEMGGVGGVSTYPQHRRKGAIRGCLRASYEDAYNRGVPFFYLYAFSEAFYRQYEFERCCTTIQWNFDLRTIPSSKIAGKFILYRGEDDIQKFQQVYDAAAKRFNMMVQRDIYSYEKLKKAHPFKTNRFAYLYEDAQGDPKAYLIFEKSGDAMEVSELIFSDFESLKAVLSFSKSFLPNYSRIRFRAPAHINLDYFCTDYCQSSSGRPIQLNGMARIVHLEKVLQMASYRGSGTIAIRISDGDLEQNNGTFEVVFQDGKAISVAKKDNIAPDLEMPISRLSRAIIGDYHTEDLLYVGDVVLHCSLEKAGQMIYRKP